MQGVKGMLLALSLLTTTDPTNVWVSTPTDFTKINTLYSFSYGGTPMLLAGGTTASGFSTLQCYANGVWRGLDTTLTEVNGVAFGIAAGSFPYLIAVGYKDGVTGGVQMSTDFSTFTEEVTSLSIGRDVIFDTNYQVFRAVGYSDGSAFGTGVAGYPTAWNIETTPFTDAYAIGGNEISAFFLALGHDPILGGVATASNLTGSWEPGESLYATGGDYRMRHLSTVWFACGPSSIRYNLEGTLGGWSNATNFFDSPRDVAFDSTFFVAGGQCDGTSNISSIAYTSTLNNFTNTVFSYTASTILQMSTNEVLVGSTILSTEPIFTSTVAGLGSAGYISSAKNVYIYSSITSYTLYTQSTLLYLSDGILNVNGNQFTYLEGLTSTVDGLGSVGYLSGIVTSTVSGLEGLGYLRNPLSTLINFVVSDISFLDANTILTASSGTLFNAGDPFVKTTEAISTIDSLGNIYVSSPTFAVDLISTVEGLGSFGIVSSLDLISSIDGLGNEGLISSLSLQSTIEGLSASGYFSTFPLERTVYQSSFQVQGQTVRTGFADYSFFLLQSNTMDGAIDFVNTKTNPYLNGVPNSSYKRITVDIFANLTLYFYTPLVSDLPINISLFSDGPTFWDTIQYIIPAGTTQWYVDSFQFKTQSVGNGLFLNDPTLSGVGDFSFSISDHNSYFVTINNMDE